MKHTHAFLERLVHYYHVLLTPGAAEEGATFTSAEIARGLHMDESQVRRDLGRLGLRGQPRVGFARADAVAAIRSVMGLDLSWNAVIVGMGRLGTALASYGRFAAYGLEIVGGFDSDGRLAGAGVEGVRVYPASELESFLHEHRVHVGIITVPVRSAQQVADTLVRGRVKAIWNFATVSLDVPADVFVRNEHIPVGLGELTFFLKNAGNA
jgi:redox-sensing transcriptional repressor